MTDVPLTRTETPVLEPVTMINAFTVPVEESERFLRRWKSNAEIMASHANTLRMLNDPELHIQARPSIYEVVVEVEPGARLLP
ncbi:hypothetical protein [Nonomuraea jabiensis]|uniref:hypothetical protein n=1 Tax=Nonomuraea jabiensis TaxID=882448 RepID=UPI003D73FD9C